MIHVFLLYKRQNYKINHLSNGNNHNLLQQLYFIHFFSIHRNHQLGGATHLHSGNNSEYRRNRHFLQEVIYVDARGGDTGVPESRLGAGGIDIGHTEVRHLMVV